MIYEDEKWIKVYTRDTAAWLALPWQARGLMLEIARKIPPLTGELSLGRKGLQTIAALLRAEWSEIEPHVLELIADGRLEYDEEQQLLRDPQHVERQTAIASGAARNRTYKERQALKSATRKVPKKTRKVAVTESDAVVTLGDAERPLEETRLDQTRPDESENARAPEDRPSQPHNDAPPCATPTSLVSVDDGLVHSTLPLLDDARARYASYAENRHLDTSVEDAWLGFVGNHAGQRFGSRDGVLGKFQLWLVRQFRLDEKARAERRAREDREAARDAAFAARFPPKSETAPMTPYRLVSDAPEREPTAEELAETRRLAAQGMPFLERKTGTE